MTTTTTPVQSSAVRCWRTVTRTSWRHGTCAALLPAWGLWLAAVAAAVMTPPPTRLMSPVRGPAAREHRDHAGNQAPGPPDSPGLTASRLVRVPKSSPEDAPARLLGEHEPLPSVPDPGPSRCPARSGCGAWPAGHRRCRPAGAGPR